MKKVLYFVLVGLFIFIIANCGIINNTDTENETSTEKGSVSLSISNAPSSVSSATGYVYASDIDTVTGNLSKSGSTITGTISGILAGSNRYLCVDAKDSSGNVIYQGIAGPFTITANKYTSVSITLYPLTGGVIVNGTISDTVLTLIKTFGTSNDDNLGDIVSTSDGGYMITAWHKPSGSTYEDFYAIKLDSSCSQIWYNNFGTSKTETAQKVAQTSDGGYLFTGASNYIDNYSDMYVIKCNSSGNQVWTQNIGTSGKTDGGEDIFEASDGNYILMGYYDNDNTSIGLIKMNTSGETIWNRNLQYSSQTIGYGMDQTLDNGFIIVGATRPTSTVYLIKTDSTGTKEWEYTYGSGYGMDVKSTSDGGYIIVGWYSGNVILIKVNSLGIQQWNKTYNNSQTEVGTAILQTSDGGYLIAAYTEPSANQADIWLIKTDSNGDAVWTKTYGGSAGEVPYGITQSLDGGYAIVGYTSSYGAGGKDIYFIKTDSEGNVDGYQSLGNKN